MRGVLVRTTTFFNCRPCPAQRPLARLKEAISASADGNPFHMLCARWRSNITYILIAGSDTCVERFRNSASICCCVLSKSSSPVALCRRNQDVSSNKVRRLHPPLLRHLAIDLFEIRIGHFPCAGCKLSS